MVYKRYPYTYGNYYQQSARPQKIKEENDGTANKDTGSSKTKPVADIPMPNEKEKANAKESPIKRSIAISDLSDSDTSAKSKMPLLQDTIGEASITDDGNRNFKLPFLNSFFNKLQIEDILLLAVIFLLFFEGKKDDLLLVLLVYILLF